MGKILLVSQKSSELLLLCSGNATLLLNLINDIGVELTDSL